MYLSLPDVSRPLINQLRRDSHDDVDNQIFEDDLNIEILESITDTFTGPDVTTDDEYEMTTENEEGTEQPITTTLSAAPTTTTLSAVSTTSEKTGGSGEYKIQDFQDNTKSSVA